MRIALFCHSLLSDWNHGNAHFLRGVASELMRRGHSVEVYEPDDAWSYVNLVAEHGLSAFREFSAGYPQLGSTRYDRANIDISDLLRDIDLVIVHEWNDPDLVAGIGAHHRKHPEYTLLFHDTHHRAASAPHEMNRLDLRDYDGVL